MKVLIVWKSHWLLGAEWYHIRRYARRDRRVPQQLYHSVTSFNSVTGLILKKWPPPVTPFSTAELARSSIAFSKEAMTSTRSCSDAVAQKLVIESQSSAAS